MKQYKEVFPRAHTFIAVIHVANTVQAIRNASIAFGHGADGIFLINHTSDVPYWELSEILSAVRDVCPGKWIGLNFLDLLPLWAVMTLPDSADGLWVDNGGIVEGVLNPPEDAIVVADEITRREPWPHLYFGGVAFKHQRKVGDADLERVCKLAMKYIPIVTTSGDATGLSPDVSKIERMRQAIGPAHPLAIASGMTPDNVREYMPYADCFIVATGISSSFTELDPIKVNAFRNALDC